MSTTSNQIKITVTPKSQKERESLERYFKSRKFDYTVRDGSTVANKSPEVKELENAFCKLAGVSRFRYTETEKAEVDSGKTSRAKVIKARIRELEKAQAAAAA